jgi:hypothetical protein
MLRNTILAAVFVIIGLQVALSANPIAMPNGSYIDEDLHIAIAPDGNSLEATVTSEFALYPRNYPVTTILFPVPRDTRNVNVFLVEGSVETLVAWQWSALPLNYTTIVTEEPNLPIIQWDGYWLVNTTTRFKVTYQHDLIERPDEKVFFYASGVSKLSGTTQFFNVDFDITLPPCYSVNTLHQDTTPWPYTQTGYTMNFLIHPSESGAGDLGFRIYTDTILSLKPDTAACDCSGNGIPDYEELSYAVTFFVPRIWRGSPPTITPADYEGDFDGDGDIDKLTCNFTQGTATVMLNDGAGNYTAAQAFGAHSLAHAKVFDIDADGDKDFILAVTTKDNLGIEYPSAAIYLNDGHGRVRPGPVLTLTSASWSTPLQVNCTRTGPATDVILWYDTYGVVSASDFRVNSLIAPTAADINSNHIPDYCEGLIPGDLDFNGTRDVNDVIAFSQQWLRTDCTPPVWCSGADADHDNIVHFIDYALFANAWIHEEN